MKVVATVSPAEAPALEQALQRAQIAHTTSTTLDDNGLEVTGFLVADELYEQACTAIEAWDALTAGDRQREQKRQCPHCGSANLDQLEDLENFPTVTRISTAYRCQDCGRIVAIS